MYFLFYFWDCVTHQWDFEKNREYFSKLWALCKSKLPVVDKLYGRQTDGFFKINYIYLLHFSKGTINIIKQANIDSNENN